jgi:hypothetical protein
VIVASIGPGLGFLLRPPGVYFLGAGLAAVVIAVVLALRGRPE